MGLPESLLQQQRQLESANSGQRNEFATGVKSVLFTMIQPRKQGLLAEAVIKAEEKERRVASQEVQEIKVQYEESRLQAKTTDLPADSSWEEPAKRGMLVTSTILKYALSSAKENVRRARNATWCIPRKFWHLFQGTP